MVVRNKQSLLPRIAVHRPITVLMTLVALIVVGFIAFKQISVQLMPAGFTPNFLGVWTPYPNSTPQEVEEQIAKPIEEQVQTISGVRRINTSSSSNGCWTFIEFAQGTDMDLAHAQLRDRMERVKPELPEDVERIYVRKWSNDDEPILWVMMAKTKPIEDTYLIIEQHVQKPLERVDGIAKVEIYGADEKSVLIEINQDKVKTHKINLFNIIQELRADNFALSSGYVSEGNRKIFVRSLGKFKSLAGIKSLPISGTNILLKDIADVQYDVPEKRWRNKIDGQDAVGIALYKESTANTVALSRRVKDIFEKEFKDDPALSSFQTKILFNQGEWIEESIDNVQRTALWGGIFAFLVLFFFLRRFRMTLIVNFAIPLSLLFTVIVLYFSNWSLNLITMMGLMISVGMVVDNSIVVLENIYRKRADGKDNRTSALVGASEVGLAITMATLTTIVVFLPLILMADDTGFRFFMLRIGLPVVIALIASLFVAMLFIPLAATKIVSKRTVSEAKVIVKSNAYYRKTLSWVLEHRVHAFVILFLILISMFYASGQAKYNYENEGNINDIRLFFDLPENFTIEQTEGIFKTVEDTVRTKQDIYGIRTINSRYSHNRGRMRIFLHPPPKKDWYEVVYDNIIKQFGVLPDGMMERDAVLKDLKKRLPELPGINIRTSWRRSSSQEDASMSIALYGDDTGTLQNLAKEIERRLRSIEEVVSVEADYEKGNNEIHLYIKRDQAKKYGISPRMISGTVQYALRGFPLPKYHTPDKEIDVHIQLQKSDRQNLSQLRNLTFFTDQGREIPLDAIATFRIEKGIGEIQRQNGKTYLRVKVNSTKDNMKPLYAKVDRVMEDFDMPYGYSWKKGRGFERMQENNESLKFAMILSATFVFLIMGILFESFVLPLSVILAMPFSLVGAFWMMYLTGTPIDIMSNIGFVILIGIVVNNAIVLIDLINRLRNEGWRRTEAIIEAGKQRFRPILMTAFTTIGGLLPMAVGNAAMIGIPYAPMGRTIIGGLLASTFISLVAVPWAYTIFDDMREYFKKVMAFYLIKSPEKI